MERANINTMELGNLMFGNSRGEYAVDRHEYAPIFHDFLKSNGFDEYGYHANANENGWFENEVFIVRPYYWGEDEDIAGLPNFEFKPDGTTMSWYKYPLRDAYCNKNLSVDQFREMIRRCAESMKK